MNQATGSHSELSVGSILSNGISIGVRNSIGILLTYVLYVLTLWIPYLNIGTTIALNDLTVMLARGESFSPAFIFDDSYRKKIGEFFIMRGLTLAAILGAALTAGGTTILAIGWIISGPLFVDRDLDGITSLRASYHLTDGHKLTIGLGFLMFGVLAGVIALIVVLAQSVVVIILVAFAFLIFGLPVVQGMLAHIYGVLIQDVDSTETGAVPVEPIPVH